MRIGQVVIHGSYDIQELGAFDTLINGQWDLPTPVMNIEELGK